MNSRLLKVVGIIVALLGIQVSAANAQVPVAESAGRVSEIGAQGETIHQALMQKSRRSVVRSMNGKVFEHSYNKYGQLISAKRIGGVRFHFLYAHPSDTRPYAIKKGKRASKSANDVPLSANGAPSLTIYTDLQPDVFNEASEMERYSSAVTLLSESSHGLQKDEIDDLLEELEDLGLLGGSEVQDITDIYVLEVMEITASAATGYCQTPHCSFPNLQACLDDCSRTAALGRVACGAVALWNKPAGFVCGASIEFGEINICIPGCRAGAR